MVTLETKQKYKTDLHNQQQSCQLHRRKTRTVARNVNHSRFIPTHMAVFHRCLRLQAPPSIRCSEPSRAGRARSPPRPAQHSAALLGRCCPLSAAPGAAPPAKAPASPTSQTFTSWKSLNTFIHYLIPTVCVCAWPLYKHSFRRKPER